MKSIWVKIALLFILLLAVFHEVLEYGVYDKREYIYAVCDKYSNVEKIPSPKLILIGGSSLAFGIDSKMLEDSLHLPVINMGLHANLGISFSLAEAELVAKKGDIVVFSFEYYVNDEDAINGANISKVYAYDALPEIFWYLSIKEKINYLYLRCAYLNGVNRGLHLIAEGDIQAPVWLKAFSKISILLPDNARYNTLDDTRNNIYKRSSFNVYGDIKEELIDGKNDKLGDANMERHEGYKDELELMNDCTKKLKASGVLAYYWFSPFAESQQKQNSTMIDTIQHEYSMHLNVPILNSANSGFMADSLFYNTVFHLNRTGREINTQKLLRALRLCIRS